VQQQPQLERAIAVREPAEPGHDQRELVELDPRQLERVARDRSSRGAAATTIVGPQQQDGEREGVVEHEALAVGRRGHCGQRIAARERAPKSSLRCAGAAHVERMFAESSPGDTGPAPTAGID
jgi:hypothetical protein